MIGSTLICSASVALVTANHVYCYDDRSWSYQSYNYNDRAGIDATAAFGFINAILYFIGAILANQPQSKSKPNAFVNDSPKIQNNENFYAYNTIPKLDKENKNISNYL